MREQANQHGLKLDIVDYGIACRFGKTIVMNYDLARYKEFCKSVFNHELRHSLQLSKKDFGMDLAEGSLLDNLAFSIKHPKAFSHFIPFGKYNGKAFVDLNLIGVYLIGVGLIALYFIVF